MGQNTALQLNEVRTVNAIPAARLLELVKRFTEAYPEAYVAIDDRDQCLVFYSKDGPDVAGRFLAQMLWE